jgi:ferric-dicitrate binding protein FerR (iron transport regulator)
MIYDRVYGYVGIENHSAYENVAWKDGKLIFRNEPMEKVIETLSEVFNVNIELRDASLKDYRYRATFQDETLSEILKLLKISSPIDYFEVKRRPLPDGTFESRKVIIFRAKGD